ncbi:MAG: hypothetical protein H6742_06570 [Alphaproteobacteria bacterium]|nr:hypothetical protein [Alphaproteobacteria bacterium]
MAALTGCPFVLPFIEVEENVPPAITQSSPGEDQTLFMEREQEVVFVLVQDDDLELDYVWVIDGFGVQGSATPIQAGSQVGSQLVVERLEAYDGRELSVTVYDEQGASDRRAWPIEVPESAR